MREEVPPGWSAVRRAVLTGAATGAAVTGLYFVSRYNYLLFRNLSELFGVVVSCAIFVVAYNARRFLENDFVLFLGTASLFIAGFDVFHTLAYTGIRVFPEHGGDLPTQLWIAGRYLQALSFLLAPLFIHRRVNLGLAFTGYVVASALFLGAIFGGFFPTCYVEGAGLTLFKRISEYVISLILLASAGLLIRQRAQFERRVLRLLVGSTVAGAGAEMAFTLHVDPYGLFNFVGHLFKIAAFVHLYRAVVITGLRRPQALLFRQLKQEEERLRVQHRRLEVRIQKRAAELARVSDALAAEALQRERTEQALAESERRFQEVLEGARLLAVVLDTQGNIVFCNDFLLQLTGWQREEVLGRNWFDLFIPRGYAAREVFYQSIEEGKIPAHRENEILTREGGSRLISWTNIVLRDPQGVVTGAASIGEDITEARQAAEALERQVKRLSLLNELTRSILSRDDLESMLRAVLQRLNDGLPADFGAVFLLDAGGKRATVIACAGCVGVPLSRVGVGQGTGMLVEETGFCKCLQGQTVSVIDAARTEAPLLQRFAGAGLRSLVGVPLQTGQEVLGILVMARRGVGAFRSAEATFLHQVGDQCALAIRHMRLLVELRVTYEQLHQTQREIALQERLRALGQVASGIAHDINNAISPVLIFAGLLLKEPGLSERARERLRLIQTAAEDVAKTVERLRAFYRRRSASELLQPVDLNEAVRQVIEMTRPRWESLPQRQGVVVEMRIDLQEGLSPVMGIEQEIRQALTNLIFNAVDAMPEGGTLTFRTYEVGAGEEGPEAICVEVSDTGIGMDEETRERALEPFFTTKGERGTGMGLPVVYGIMQRHEGRIEIESALGEGTTVRLVFPGRRPVEAEREEETAGLASPLRILCIDDEPLVRIALKEMLESMGHAAEVAGGGQAGLEAFHAAQERGEPFDVVITDLGMPYVSGREVVWTVKRDSPETPVIVLSGWGVRVGAEEERDTPLREDWVLSKPPKPEALQRALVHVMRGANSEGGR